MRTSFRKSIKVAPGVKLNFSKKGMTASIGPKGVKVNISNRGTYLNTNISGTGIYNRQKKSGKSASNKVLSQQGCMVFNILIISFSTLITLSCCINSNKNQANNTKELHSNLSQSGVKKEDALIPFFPPKYNKIKEEDISLAGEKRLLYRVSFPKGLTKDEIRDSFIHIVDEGKSKGANSITIFAYNHNESVEKAYTVGKFEFDADNDKIIDFSVSDTYFKKEEITTFNKGDLVVLYRDKDYSRGNKGIKPKTVKIFDNPKNMYDEKMVWEYKNGVKAKIIDVFSERLSDDSLWLVYKVKVLSKPSKEGWVADFNVRRTE